ncbi:MAG: polyphenol oxidase family protein [Raoultibacter sp.]
MMTLELVKPHLSEGRFASITALTDESLFKQIGVRIAFTQRWGGVSKGAYESLNLGSHVDDESALVLENRRIVRSAFGAGAAPCIIPRQVHGIRVLSVSSTKDAASVQRVAERGADGIIVGCSQVSALLCFADCMPVIIVSPTGHFAVVHAGWRGVESEIAAAAVRELAALDAPVLGAQAASMFNGYIGPYIHGECFEVSPEIHGGFTKKFGMSCAFDANHIDLGQAQKVSLRASGMQEERIADADACTVCCPDRYFSYRFQEGVCGRHGAFAVCVKED